MKLERLQYQLYAISAAIAAIKGENVSRNDNYHANPILRDTQNIDVKMETGTGKTYVYTRLMHELKLQFGFFKFIILVPSIAIKEGVKMSIQSDDWNKHFRQEFGNQYINLGVVNAGDFAAKKNRKQIPESLRSFCESSIVEEKTINCLLLNDAMLASKSMSDDKYENELFGSVSCPLEGLKSTRPIVIIDEPHRFNKKNKAWFSIVDGLKPLLIIRFGATFPETESGKGNEKITKKDYENLVYDLNSIRAFNDGLVKGVSIIYPALQDLTSNRYKVKITQTGKSANIGGIELKVGDKLSIIDTKFDGALTLEHNKDSKTQLKLSTDLSLESGMELSPEIYSNDYQTLLLSQALDAHFEKEAENFSRKNKIKTNSLFFIDSIASFRGEDGKRKGWLREKFEELLRKKLEKEIPIAEGAYKEFLEYSLRHISATIAGYFSEDNSKKSDEELQKEVDSILRNKEQSLKFKNANGEWNICRFFFSKWTLCEGWDNPNVFVICKLRSSGSEIRKLQEVGRGLRLPFDENGNRVSNEEFYLTYIIDYSERDFAKKLVGEINADGGILESGKITERILELLVKAEYAATNAKAKGKLLLDDIIDEKDEIKDNEKLFALLPEDSGLKIKAGKIMGEDLPKKPMVKLNKENFEKLRALWKEVTKRYLLHFKKVEENDLQEILDSVFENGIFEDAKIELITETINTNNETAQIEKGGYESAASSLNILPYGEFLKSLNKRTNLPLALLHEYIFAILKNKANAKELVNTISLENIIKSFEEKFAENFAQKYDYIPLDFTAQTSLFKPNGDFKDELPEGDLGSMFAKDVEIDGRFLYDKAMFDSEIEHEVLKIRPQNEITVYGKLPKRSIKVPTYTGGTTSPDFVYAISRDSVQTKTLHLIVETKSDNLRMSDKIAIQAQEKLFAQIPNIVWRKETDAAHFQRELERLVKE